MSVAWKNRRVLVTGGTGFVGSFLVEALLARGATVRSPLRAHNFRALSERRAEVEWMEGDLRDPAFCGRLVEGVDHVFHLASCRRNVTFHHDRCSDVLRENLRMSLALIEGMSEAAHFPPVTFFSSANVPPALDVVALAQREHTDGYVLGKALCETVWFAAARQHEFPLLILRPVGVYGPRDTFAPDGNVIPALMLRARDAKVELIVWGSGKQERSFLYVEDLIAATLALLDAGATGIQYVSAPDAISVSTLAEQIRDLLRPGLPLRFDTTKPEGARSVPVLPMHPSLVRFPWTPLAQGLKRTEDAFRRAAV